MPNAFGKWCINNDMKVIVYLIWFLVLPCYIFAYCNDAVEDAMYDFNCIKKQQKDKL